MMEDLQAKRIWPNVCSIIDGMLKRRIELAEVYEEVHASMAQTPRALYMFWDVFLHAADGWNPQKSRAARQTLYWRSSIHDAFETRSAAIADRYANKPIGRP
ncbi:hypothetical protein D3C77_327520 [compost metagenome]